MILAAGLVFVTLLGGLPSADLVDDLDSARDAEFSGRLLVVCWAPDGVVARVADIEQADGFTMVTGADRSFMIGDGKMIEQYAGGIHYLEMLPSSDWRLWEGYTVRDVPSMTGLLEARTIEILEGQSVRARFVLDPATSAPLTTEVYTGDGSLFRYSSLIELRPRTGTGMLDMDEMPAPEQPAPAAAETLPREAGHYWAADSYAGPGGVQMFFTDGLFRFSVFEISRKSDGGGLADAPSANIGRHGGYHRLHTPGAVSVFWRTPDHAYVLVGDLPPDHLEAVLSDLPTPSRPNLLKRAWRWAFG